MSNARDDNETDGTNEAGNPVQTALGVALFVALLAGGVVLGPPLPWFVAAGLVGSAANALVLRDAIARAGGEPWGATKLAVWGCIGSVGAVALVWWGVLGGHVGGGRIPG